MGHKEMVVDQKFQGACLLLIQIQSFCHPLYNDLPHLTMIFGKALAHIMQKQREV